MKKILIIGQNSFVATNIFNNFKNYFYIKKLNFLKFSKLKKKDLIKYDYIINCSILKKYVSQKYQFSNDLDLKL